MQIHSILRGLCCAALAATPLYAQFVPSAELGTRLPGVDGFDDVVTQPLGFSFTMPDGSVVTDIDINTHVRIFAGGAGNADFANDVATFLGGPTSIAPLWEDQVSTLIYFSNPAPDRAVITWVDAARTVGQNEIYTVQCELDGTTDEVVFRYDSRVPPLGATVGQAGDAIVGLTEGAPTAAGSSQDLSAGPIVGTTPTLFERFDTMTATGVDLQSTEIVFTPTGAGYVTTVTTGLADPGYTPGRINPPGSRANSGCASFEVTFTFLGGGQYLVTPGTIADDADFATTPELGFAGNSTINPIISASLPFSFPWPGGSSSTMVDVIDDGTVSFPGVGNSLPFGVPNPTNLRSATGPVIAPMWSRTSGAFASAPAGEGVFVHDIGAGPGAGRASVTWSGVGQWALADAGGGPGLFVFGGTEQTFQLVLAESGDFSFKYLDVDYIVGVNGNAGGVPVPPGTLGTPVEWVADSDVVVGYSEGQDAMGNPATDPGEADILADLAASAIAGTTYYEWHQNFNPPGGMLEQNGFDQDNIDVPNQGAQLIALTQPAYGSNFQVDVNDSTATGITAVTYLVGPEASPALSLGFLNPDLNLCSLTVDLGSPFFRTRSGVPGTATQIYDLTALQAGTPLADVLTVLTGQLRTWRVQGLAIAPGESPSIFPTNDLVIVIGN